MGFDEFFGFMAGVHDYYESRIPTVEAYRSLMSLVPKMDVAISWGENGIIYNIQRYSPILHNTQPVEKYEYLTLEFTNRAIDWIERDQEQPFFLYLSYNAVHHPHQAPREYLDRRDPDASVEDAKAQLAQIDCLDAEMGRLMAVLDTPGIRENTLVVLVGDNGGLSFEGANWKLRGHKGQLFEGGIRVPCIVSWPGVLPEGKVYDHPIMQMDLVPTLVEAAKLDVPREVFDGVSLLPYWRREQKEAPHEILFWGLRGEGFAVREGNWKLVRNFHDDEIGLYDLAEDISENNNRIKEKPGIYARLNERLSEWRHTMVQGR